MKPPFAISAAIATVTLLSACGADAPPSAAPTPAPAITATPTSPSAAPTLDDVVAKLTAVGATNPFIATEDTDPNKLLGRPGQYTARAGLDYPGGDPAAETGRIDRGIVVEIHPDAAAAAARSKYILDTLKAGGPILGVEYHYLNDTVLVRVTGKTTPTDARRIEAAVKGL